MNHKTILRTFGMSTRVQQVTGFVIVLAGMLMVISGLSILVLSAFLK